MSQQYIRYPTLGGGGSGVSSLNTLTGAVTLAAGTNITLVPVGNTITINSTGGGGVSSLNSLTGALNITAGTGITVTPSSPNVSVAITTNGVTNSLLSQMATLTIKGNNTGGTANAADLTVAQVNAILPVFTSTLNGIVPASGGGTTNFLRADGTWAVAGSGTVTAVSVATANGFAGTSSGGTTPALTLTTTLNTPVIAGNGTALIAATTTGSGSTVVLATSPTLVTPVIGAATGTSLQLSGLTASQAVVTDASKNLTSLLYTASNTNSSITSRDLNGNSSFNNVITTVTSTVTSGQTIAMTAGSAGTQLVTGSSGITFTLPDATTLYSNQNYSFNNNSTGSITVNDNSNALVATIPGGGFSTVVNTSNATTAGVWDHHESLAHNATSGTSGTTFPGTLSAASTVTGTQLISTVSTGTAPLTVTSTTPVANLVASNINATSNSTLTTLSALSLPYSQVTGGPSTNAITALTGDGTAAGPGSVGLTLATVNLNTGSFGSSTSIPSFTVNGKGLITAASGNVVIAPAGTLTGTTLNSTVVTSSLTALGVQSQILDLGSHNINNVTDPTTAQQAATKNYVDLVASSLQTIQAVSLASASTNYPGSMVGNVLTITATGAISIDGSTPTINSRVLLKDQSTASQNGVYNVTTVGTTGVSPVLTRAADYNTAADVNAGGLIPVISGTVNATTSWLQTATVTTINVDSLVFAEWTANPANYLLKANNLSDVSSKSTSFNNISPITSTGDIIIGTGTNTASRLAIGTNTYVLTSNGTTATWAASTGGFANPMTTLGDTIYGGASGAATRLAGDTSNTRKFLRELSVTSVATAPVWDTLVSGDIPNNAANTTGTASNVTGIVLPVNGGTGIANNNSSTLTISGNFATTLTVTGTTGVTLPTTGTLATLAGTETLSNKTLGNATTFTQVTTPSTPSAGSDKLYFKSGDGLYTLNSAGIETLLTPSSAVATYLWSGYHSSSNGNNWTRANSAFGDFSNNDSSVALSQSYNSNFGTVTGYGATSGASALPGIVFSPPVAGYYYIKASFPVNQGNVAQFMATRLYDITGSSIIDASGGNYLSSGGSIDTISLSGIIQYTTTTSKTIAIQGASSGGSNFYIDNAIRFSSAQGHSIEWTIFAVSLTSPAASSIQTINTITMNTTLSSAYNYVLVNGSGAVTVTLPSPVTGTTYTIKNISTFTTTITPTSGTIDGAASFLIPIQYTSVSLITDGTNWFITGGTYMTPGQVGARTNYTV